MAFQRATIPLRPSLHGKRLGIGPNGELVSNDRIMLPNPDYPGLRCVLFDDFLGDVLRDPWGVQSGSDAQALDPAITADLNGVVRAVAGDSNANLAADGSQLESQLNWQADQGNLDFECRFRINNITTVAFFIGLTDQVGALEMPIYSAGSANTITTDATDAAGMFFDTRMTDDNIWLAGVDNGTDATHVDSGEAPVNDTWKRFRMELDTSGNGRFFLDGDWIADIDDVVKADVPLSPVVVVQSLTTAVRNLDIDYIHVAQDR